MSWFVFLDVNLKGGCTVRVMLTSQFGHGHWRPLAGLASVLVAAGHAVAFATTPGNCEHLRDHGFVCFPVGIDDDGGAVPGERAPGAVALDPAEAVWRHVFAGRRIEQMLPGMLVAARAWRPDLIVREISDFSGALAGELLGTPVAVLQVSSWRPAMYAAVGAAVNEHRVRLGLPVEDESTYFESWRLLSPEPPEFRHPGMRYPPATYPIRLPLFDTATSGDETEPVQHTSDRQRVFATLGTAYNQHPELFRAILAATQALDLDLVMTTGVNPESLGLVAAGEGVFLRPYVPLSSVLPNCDLVISHGGFGTFQAALRHGLPQIVLPLAADQPDNARHCAAYGTGMALWQDERSVEQLATAIRTVRDGPSYHRAAERWRDAIDRLPGPDAAVETLELLAGDDPGATAEGDDEIA